MLALGACSGSMSGQPPGSGGSGSGTGGSSATGGSGSGGSTSGSTGGTVAPGSGGANGSASGGVNGSASGGAASGGTTGSATGGSAGSASSGSGGAAGNGGRGGRTGGGGAGNASSGSGGAGGGPGTAGGCTRELLKGTLDAYFKALAAHSADGLPLADTVKATENGKTIKVGTDGLWKTAGTLTYAHSALDTDGCNAASEAVVPENGKDIPVALRLKLQDGKTGKEITEIETIAVRQGDYSVASNTAAIIASGTSIGWEKSVAADKRDTRETITAWMAKYFQLFPGGVCKTTSDCKRLENGGGSFTCDAQASCKADSTAAPAIKSHIIFADVETGIGVGFDAFMGNADMHMFKMYGGMVYAVHAILGKASSTGWNDK